AERPAQRDNQIDRRPVEEVERVAGVAQRDQGLAAQHLCQPRPSGPQEPNERNRKREREEVPVNLADQTGAGHHGGYHKGTAGRTDGAAPPRRRRRATPRPPRPQQTANEELPHSERRQIIRYPQVARDEPYRGCQENRAARVKAEAKEDEGAA